MDCFYVVGFIILFYGFTLWAATGEVAYKTRLINDTHFQMTKKPSIFCFSLGILCVLAIMLRVTPYLLELISDSAWLDGAGLPHMVASWKVETHSPADARGQCNGPSIYSLHLDWRQLQNRKEETVKSWSNPVVTALQKLSKYQISLWECKKKQGNIWAHHLWFYNGKLPLSPLSIIKVAARTSARDL